MRELTGSILFNFEAATAGNAEFSDDFREFAEWPGLFICGDVLIDCSCSNSACSLDADLREVLTAYEKWGIDCPTHLTGDFAFALWDARRRLLLCARDHLGTKPFFYWTDGRQIRFASSVQALLADRQIPRELNRQKLAAFSLPFHQWPADDETLHAGIRSLPCATVMISENGRTRQQRYWKPEIRPSLVPLNEGDAFAELQSLVLKSVRRQTKRSRKPAVLLSGGLDSSAVTAAGARVASESGRSLLAFAGVPEASDAGLPSERKFMAEFESWPGVSVHYVSAPGRGPFDWLRKPERFAETFLRTSRIYLYAALCDGAKAAGADLVMEGTRGELGISANGGNYALELLLRGRITALKKLMGQLSRTCGISPVRYLGSKLRRYAFPGSQRAPLLYFNRNFRRHANSTPEPRGPLDHRLAHLGAIEKKLQQQSFPDVWHDETIPCSQPLYDRHILEFCLATSGDLKFQTGRPRSLVRGAMKGLMPEKIRLRTSKVPFSPDYAARYASQAGIAREFVASIGKGDPVREVVDVDQLGRKLAPDGAAANSFEALTAIPVSIYLICFLRQFSMFRN